MLNRNLITEDASSQELIQDLLEKDNYIPEKADSAIEIDLSFTSPKIVLDNYIDESQEVSDLDLLQHRNGWLDRNLNSLIEFEDVSAFRCNCPACRGDSRQESRQNADSISSVSAFDFAATVPTNSLAQGLINTLLTPYKWTNKTITYSFYENDIFKGAYYSTETGVKEVSDKIKQNVRKILESVETFIGLDFVEVTETNTSTFGQIRYMLSNNPGYAYAYLPFSTTDHRAGDVHLNPAYDNTLDTNGFQNDPGQHGYTTLIHETFHALGLEHPHESGDGDVLDANLDNLSTTVMTYDFKGNSPGTAMAYDIAALQQVYGATNYNALNDTYVFGTTTDVFTVNGQFPVLPNQRLKQTIWDSSGVDTLDFSKLGSQSTGYLFDLSPGGWLVANAQNLITSTGEKYYNYGTSLAYGANIENIIGSVSNDTIVANEIANKFSGYVKGVFAGNDTLVNTNQLDTLDLSSYKQSEITQTQNSNDLLIKLGVGGSVTVKNYYAVPETSRLKISLASSEPVVNFKAIAEVGRITNINQNLQTITLKNDYVNPVVFAQPLSFKASDPAIVRITNINTTNDTLSFYLQEPKYRDGTHVNESFSYMVVEAGTWKLANGTLLEVGKLNTNQVSASGWQNISFNHNFTTTPVVLSQVQSNNDTQFVRTRQRNANADGFSITLEEEEALMKSGHGTESVGWLAISSSSGQWDGLNYQARNTGNAVNHNWYKTNSTPYKTTPNLLGSIASYNDLDPVGLRYREVLGTTGRTIQVKLEEDKSFDTELRHATEQVNLLTIEGSGILQAQAYDPLAASIVTDSFLEDSFALTNTDAI